MSFLYFLEDLRVPCLNTLMLLITRLGEETPFLVIALILFWCVNKRHGYLLLSVGFMGTLATQFIKILLRIPRPWVIDPEFSILEAAREGASGYSFPSGHSQTSVGTFGTITAVTKNKAIRIAAILLAILVPFSRMYIGVHTPKDVVVGAVISIGLIILLRPLVLAKDGKHFPLLIAAMTALILSYVCFIEHYPFPDDVEVSAIASAAKNAYTLLGALIGLLVVYIVDEIWLHFSTTAVWWAQILKTVFGLGIILVVKSGLKTPLNTIFGENPGRAIRYFLIVIVAGILWPLTFRWFSKLGKKV